MPKKHRLSHADFETIRPAIRERGAFFTVGWSKNHENKPKIAVIVSKKVAARAVERNRIKRRTLACLREVSPAIAPGTWVFTAKREAKDAEFVQIVEDIKTLLRKVSR